MVQVILAGSLIESYPVLDPASLLGTDGEQNDEPSTRPAG
jgi:hypothetical protein